jgi:hypothetical protein
MTVVANRLTERFGRSMDMAKHRRVFRDFAAKLLGLCRIKVHSHDRDMFAGKLQNILRNIGRPAEVC